MRSLSFAHITTLALACALFIFPTTLFAQDARCFTQSECENARREFGIPENEIKDGFYTGTDAISACGKTRQLDNGNIENLGFCMPAGYTETQLSFGGRQNFLHMGDFLIYLQQYGFLFAVVVAILVVILSGIQWMMSGDNSAGIQSAKKRIGGALAGLALLVFAVPLLGTISPQFVNLRLPQVWLINQQRIISPYCDALPENTNLGRLTHGEQNATGADRERAINQQNRPFDIKKEDALCGETYVVDTPGGAVCAGTFCTTVGDICSMPNPNRPRCRPSILTGQVTAKESLFCNDLAQTKIMDEISLMALCRNGSIERIPNAVSPNIDNDTKVQYYEFLRSTHDPQDIAGGACNNNEGILGYFLSAQINDKGAFLCQTGSDDWFAIGKTPLNGTSASVYSCNVNLARVAQQIINNTPNCKNHTEDLRCSCAGLPDALKNKKKQLTENDEFKRFLFSFDDLTAGKVCDIHITREEFPAMNQSTNLSSCEIDF